MIERLTADISRDLRASAQDIRAEHRNTDAGLLTEAADKLDGLIALLAEAEAKLRGEVSGEKCGGDGCPGCPGCTALTAERDRLREDWEYRGHQLDDAATVGRALIDERDRLAAELAEMRPLVVAARRLLDQVAETEAVQNGHPDLAERAADLAQRIVDEIGHPVTDEPALGPSYREQLAALTAERNWLADTLRRYGLVIEAAKAWRIAARASEVFRLEASLETGTTMADLSTAVDALDASPGDAQTGPQDDEPAGTEQGDADG